MELLLVRHGIAADGSPDESRALTKEGRRKTRAAARGLAALVDIGVVATSPLTRAVQTAELLGTAVVIVDALRPGRPLREALAWIRSRRERRITLVGHEPHLSTLASWLMTGHEHSVLAMKKSQAVLLEMDAWEPGTARLLWSLPPRASRALH
jgi:phosphohistidine phosphatase